MTDHAAPLSSEEVAAWRERFPILSSCTYLINNSLGAMPEATRGSLAEFAELWASKGVEAWTSDWLPEVRRVADLLGSLLGAPAGTVVVHQNVATLTSVVLSALDFAAPRDGVVIADADWPSHHYLLSQRRLGRPRVQLVETDGVHVDTDRFVGSIDETTALVIVSHVMFRSAFINDVDAIAARAREVGAWCLVDGYHATGHLPVDVEAIGCDLYVGGSVKWLCGGPGVGYLYASPEARAALGPGEVGWLGHARPFAFERDWEPADGAMGWLGGTPSMPALYAARSGYAAIAEVGPARIRATSKPLTARLVDGARDHGFAVRTPLDPERRAGAVTIDLGAATEAASRRLIDAGIIVDYRPDAGIRVGPHFFSTLEECDALLDALSAG